MAVMESFSITAEPKQLGDYPFSIFHCASEINRRLGMVD
jgi:hypothetical protein